MPTRGNRENMLARQRVYNRTIRKKEDPEKARIRTAAWRAANPERAKEILRKAVKKWTAANPDKVRGYAIKRGRRRAGLPEPERWCPGVCECCGKPPGKKAMDLDHCHVTGDFRGWLCGKCNAGIGLLGDSEEGLLLAIEYLKRKELNMGAAELIGVLISLINAGVNGIAAAQRVSGVIQQRRDEGKPFTKEDLEQAVGQDDEARKLLQDAIANAV